MVELPPNCAGEGAEASLLPPAGQFGAGTESYFSLLRFLLFLNLVASVIEVCMKLVPAWLEGAPPGSPSPNISSPCGSYAPHTQGLVSFPTQLFNLLSGEVGATVSGFLSDLWSRSPGSLILASAAAEPHSDPYSASSSPGLPRMVPSVLWVLPTPIEPGHPLPVLRLRHRAHLLAVHPTPVSDTH